MAQSCLHCGNTELGNGLFCPRCEYHIPGRTFTSINPVPWGESESQIFNDNKDKSIKATDHFIDERSKWTATSSKLRNWEKDRKKAWAKDKPAWRKKQAEKGAV